MAEQTIRGARWLQQIRERVGGWVHPFTPRTAALRAQAHTDGRTRQAPLWWSHPPSLAELAEYTAAGDWVPGERAPVLEAAGKAYGYLIAIPASAALYVVSWLLQRPSRLLLACGVAAAVWVTR